MIRVFRGLREAGRIMLLGLIPASLVSGSHPEFDANRVRGFLLDLLSTIEIVILFLSESIDFVLQFQKSLKWRKRKAAGADRVKGPEDRPSILRAQQ